MATELTKAVTRKTNVTLYDRRKLRPLIVSIEPAGHDNARIGIRIAGTRETYRLGIQTILNLAIRKHQDDTERLAKKIAKDEAIPMRSARVKARKAMTKELK